MNKFLLFAAFLYIVYSKTICGLDMEVTKADECYAAELQDQAKQCCLIQNKTVTPAKLNCDEFEKASVEEIKKNHPEYKDFDITCKSSSSYLKIGFVLLISMLL